MNKTANNYCSFSSRKFPIRLRDDLRVFATAKGLTMQEAIVQVIECGLGEQVSKVGRRVPMGIPDYEPDGGYQSVEQLLEEL